MANNNNPHNPILDKVADVVTTAVVSEAIIDAIHDAWGPPKQEEGGNEAAIAKGDTEAGRVNNTAVVSDGDVGALLAAYSSIDGASAEGQFAQARVGAAIDAARAKLAAAKASGDYNPADSAAAAQQFGSEDEYRAFKQRQATEIKLLEEQAKKST